MASKAVVCNCFYDEKLLSAACDALKAVPAQHPVAAQRRRFLQCFFMTNALGECNAVAPVFTATDKRYLFNSYKSIKSLDYKAKRLFILNAGLLAVPSPPPQRSARQNHWHAQPLPHAHAQCQDAQKVVGFAEKLGDEAKHAVAE